VVEPGPPRPQRDAGSRAIVDFLEALRDEGFSVELGLESAPTALAGLIARKPRVCVLSRPGTFLRQEGRFDRAVTSVCYFAHDVHSDRMRGGVGLNQLFTASAADAMEIVERLCFSRADVTLVPTPEEVTRVRHIAPQSHPVAINYYWFDTSHVSPRVSVLPRVVFVGSVGHAPNEDGLEWFLGRMWPEIAHRHPGSKCVAVGQWQDVVDRLGSKRVSVRSHLSDDELDSLLAESSVGVAPLRFGAGMKRKTLHYLSQGLPTVTTPIGVQGLTELVSGDHGAFVGESEEDLIEAVSAILASPSTRLEMSRQALDYVGSRFGYHNYIDALRHALPI
jgi:O-antigen biosynthesis protein